ncbi:MAG: hypothetical protein ACJ78R_02765 [Gemmatimonadaceae bacterium]
MSDTRNSTDSEPHPASSHRTPHEIAEDEAGPIGGGVRNHPRKNLRAEDGPVRKLDELSDDSTVGKTAKDSKARP